MTERVGPTDDELVDAAREATQDAYVPYSEYRVGAALVADDGAVYTGCNLENANYSNSLHAEEVGAEDYPRQHRAEEDWGEDSQSPQGFDAPEQQQHDVGEADSQER